MFQTYSPNMLKTYEHCPKKFFFRYVKNITMPVNDEIFEQGKNIHALAAYYLKKENIDNLEKELNPNERKIWDYLKSHNYIKYEIVNTEYTLSLKINNYFFSGRIDALVKKDERYYILDYKTGFVPQNAKYDYQTMIYMLAVKSFFSTDKVTFVYLDLKKQDEVKIDLTEPLVAEYETRLKNIVKQISLEDYSKKQANCNCEYNIICY